MRAEELLHRTIKYEQPKIHKYRLNSLFLGCKSLLSGERLSVTALGRNLAHTAKVRSCVKRFDRLLSNPRMHRDLPNIYSVLAGIVLNGSSQPWIHIDWSCVSVINQLYVLRACVSVKGRGITLYEEVYPKANEHSPPTHSRFLEQLKAQLPPGIRPVIVTDAGFRSAWFKSVLEIGWDFVGRVRNKNVVKFKDDNWVSTKSLYERATTKPSKLGCGLLTRRLQVPCQFVAFKKALRNRKVLTKRKELKSGRHHQLYSRSTREPWLLATSLKNSAVEVARIYKQRMQIEENFRDTKSFRYGFGLEHSRTRCPKRMAVLLLINAMTAIQCWIAGIAMIKQGRAQDYQVQSAKIKNAISIPFLGRQALRRKYRISNRMFNDAFLYIQKLIKLLELDDV